MFKIRPIFICFIGLLFILIMGATITTVYERNTNYCVMYKPPQVKDGTIFSPSGGLFGPMRYRLSFKGLHKKTKEECTVTKEVTMSEYERWMYVN